MFLFFALVVGLTAGAAAQEKPVFKFSEEEFNFGKIPQAVPVTHVFNFTNTGEEPLILSNVQPTCGCTVANYTKTPIMKGQKGTIQITYDAAVIMPFIKKIVVTSNATTPIKELTIRGEVVKPTK